MNVWKYCTLCRENEVNPWGRITRLGVAALFLTACVAGPTPHPAEPNLSSGLDTGATVPQGPEATNENDSGAGMADAWTSNDVLSNLDGDVSDLGPDVADTTSDTASDTVTDTASDAVTDTPSDTASDAVSDGQGSSGVDTATDEAG